MLDRAVPSLRPSSRWRNLMHRTALGLAVVLSLTLPGCVVGWEGCDHTAPREATVDATGARSIRIEAAAGSLTVVGREGLGAIQASGTACAGSEERLAHVELVARRDGDVVEILVDIPDGRGNAALDLRVEVPRGLPVEVRDSSGDAEIRGVASAKVRDSSGNLTIAEVDGDLAIEDSSGDIDVSDVRGLVTVADSSGNIRVERVAALEVEDDSSGDLAARDVDGDVRVRRDSSGDIDVDGVGGDFVVDRDGSGSIRHRGVAGAVDVPED